MKLVFSHMSFVFFLVTPLCTALQNPVEANKTSAAPGTVRFAVAHEHEGSWCLGWLYVNGDNIRYVVEQPADGSHSFLIERSEVISLSKWTVNGQTTNAFELKTAKATYHFWWLADENDIQTRKPYQSPPQDAAPSDEVIRIIQSPSSAIVAHSEQVSAAAQSKSALQSNSSANLERASSEDGQLATLKDAKIPPLSKVYVAPMADGFENYIIAGLRSKKVPLTVVIDRSRADYEISGVSESEKADWAKMLFAGSQNSAEQASVKVANLKTGEVIFGYSVHKGNSARGRQSAGEACAKHLKAIVSE